MGLRKELATAIYTVKTKGPDAPALHCGQTKVLKSGAFMLEMDGRSALCSPHVVVNREGRASK